MLVITISVLLLTIFVEGKVFFGVPTDANYETAKQSCPQLSAGAQLATFSSQDEYEKLVEIARTTGTWAVWIGLDDIAQEGKWNFIDGDQTYWFVLHILFFLINLIIYIHTVVEIVIIFLNGNQVNQIVIQVKIVLKLIRDQSN